MIILGNLPNILNIGILSNIGITINNEIIGAKTGLNIDPKTMEINPKKNKALLEIRDLLLVIEKINPKPKITNEKSVESRQSWDANVVETRDSTQTIDRSFKFLPTLLRISK